MGILDIQKQLKEINKLYYTTSDIGQILNKKGNTLRVMIHRILKKDILIPIKQGVYVLPEHIVNLDAIINQLYFPSYLSFETALSRYGIINQIPYTLSFAWQRNSKRFHVGEFTVELRHINSQLFFGYKLQEKLMIAYPEKALLDQLYFVSLGKAHLDFDELNLHELSKGQFLTWAKRFPIRTQALAEKIAKDFGKISVTIK